ncbi:MAG: hypothetical protein J1E82_03915 [Muribaculaceae bacterium]|nr:hypothetical protein [Muribaculaceae bacterium]
MIYRIKHIFAIIGVLSILSLISCSDNGPGENNRITDPLSGDVYAMFATRGDDDMNPDDDSDSDVIIDVTTDEHDDNTEASEFFKDGFEYGDALYFTQLVSGVLVPFQAKEKDSYPTSLPESFKVKYRDGYKNLYTYYYEYKYPTGWDDRPNGLGGYNFFAKTPLEKMEWEDIQAWGYDNNGYALFAMYFPYDNELNLDFQVPENQNDIDVLRKSNFIGAYHSSSSPGRIRFKLYHLMCYFKLTLYIPVFNDNDTDDKGNKIRTGFPADALQSVQLLDVLTQFNVNWYANRSSDAAPACAAVDNGDRKNIIMFIPPLTEEYYPETKGLPPVVKIKTSSFYRPDNAAYDPEATDECWKITVSALIPAGQDFSANDLNYPGLIWTDKNFIRINMRQNIGEVPKSYVFNGNPDPVQGGHATTNSDLSIEQGGIQHLSLYIPRYGAAAVLVGAKVIDWQHAKNDNWGLNQEEPIKKEPDPEPED